MALSAFALYSIGIGPSSSHTVGPMRAAHRFTLALADAGSLGRTDRVRAELFGSLGATGRGHGSDAAIILGLQGEDPATVETAQTEARVAAVTRSGLIVLNGGHTAHLDPSVDLVLRRRSLPAHPNGMTFTAYDDQGSVLHQQTYYSIGGGFVVDEPAPLGAAPGAADRIVPDDTPVAYPFSTGEELLRLCQLHRLSISDLMLANERSWRTEAEIREGLLRIWSVMQACVQAGLTHEGVLPGAMAVPRRAPALHADLLRRTETDDPLALLDWINLWAIAVNEENASGGRVVTAPTNGAAGIIPAVLHYYTRSIPGADDEGVVRFLLTAAAIGIVIKTNASISGAEVGCQGEVGSACAMAAAGLTEILGGTPDQVENAAEVGVEHNLGLTCDPVGGLVQIPCIERNAIASVKALNAARLALHGTGHHQVSLDAVVTTMRETGRDMDAKYKETSRGGLAVNVVEC